MLVMMASSCNKLEMEMVMASSYNGMERRRIMIGQKGSGIQRFGTIGGSGVVRRL
jgi:hypothetical protein